MSPKDLFSLGTAKLWLFCLCPSPHSGPVVKAISERGRELIVVLGSASLSRKGALKKQFRTEIGVEYGVHIVGVARGSKRRRIIVTSAHQVKAEPLTQISGHADGPIRSGREGTVKFRIPRVDPDARLPYAKDGSAEHLVERTLLVVRVIALAETGVSDQVKRKLDPRASIETLV